MESITRCRKCGKKMKSERVDDYRVKLVCACGFWEFKTMPAASKAINPYYPKDAFSHIKIDESGGLIFEMERANREKMEIMTLEESITGAAAKEGKPICVKDVSKDPRYKRFAELREQDYTTMLSHPIIHKGELLGVLNVQTIAPKDFQEDEIYFVSVIGNLILSAIRIRKRI